jgi:hypothetical protein
MSMTQGLFEFSGRLYAAWKGEVGDDRLFYAVFDGASWQPGTVHIPGNSSVGPSLAAPNMSTLYAIWKGEHGDSDQRIFYSTFDGTVWTPQAQIQGWLSSVGPSLGVRNGVLYAAFKGAEGDNQIYWSQLNESTWTPKQPIPGATSVIGPSLAGYTSDGQLYAGWIGVNGQSLSFAQFDGNVWQVAPSIPGNPFSSIGPSLAQAGDSLYAAWKGEGNDERLYYAVFSNGAWSGQNQIKDVGSSIGPALAAYGPNLYAMWKGEGDDQSLYYASFNGTWSGQNPLSGNTGQDNVPPPLTGLGSNSNYLIGSGDGANLQNPSVTIMINEPLVVAPGVENFGFQLNCYSPKNSTIAWQQYLIVPHFATQTVGYGYQGWLGGKGGLAVDPKPTESLATPGNGIIPANWTFVFALECDENGNIVEAKFTVSDSTATPPWSNSKSLPLTLDVAPIVALQLNIVGPSGGTNAAVFQSGAGTITYAARKPINALRAVPASAEVSVPTAEISNIYYTNVPARASDTLAQDFGVSAG